MRDTAAKPEGKFLAEVPLEIQELLDWYDTRHARGDAPSSMSEFASKLTAESPRVTSFVV